MLSLSVLLINKYPYRIDAFSGISTNFLKRKLEITKLNNRVKNHGQGSFIFQMEPAPSINAYFKKVMTQL